jgi:hypothetical protein
MISRIANYVIVVVGAVVLPFFYGYIGRGIPEPLTLVFCVTSYNLWTGWRLNRQVGLLGSGIAGLAFSSALIFPCYFLGRWVGNSD